MISLERVRVKFTHMCDVTRTSTTYTGLEIGAQGQERS
jgi:hypothetical protein